MRFMLQPTRRLQALAWNASMRARTRSRNEQAYYSQRPKSTSASSRRATRIAGLFPKPPLPGCSTWVCCTARQCSLAFGALHESAKVSLGGLVFLVSSLWLFSCCSSTLRSIWNGGGVHMVEIVTSEVLPTF
eukprot:Amastigsp_a174945_23.p4 type:complete len:132 gc:universal Amastigsp_a174945_23:97-492(+)